MGLPPGSKFIRQVIIPSGPYKGWVGEMYQLPNGTTAIKPVGKNAPVRKAAACCTERRR